MKQVEIFCTNTNTTHYYPLGISLLEISRDLDIRFENVVCGAIVNNQVKELSFCVVKSKRIEFFDVSHPDGVRLYVRSLVFIMYVAVKEVFPLVSLRIQNGISNGLFCELQGLDREISESEIFSIQQEMKRLIQQNIPFVKKDLLTGDVVKLLAEQGLNEKAELFEQQGQLYSELYFLNELGNYFYGHLLPPAQAGTGRSAIRKDRIQALRDQNRDGLSGVTGDRDQ